MNYLCLFTRQLAAMLRAGLALAVSLERLAASFPHKGYRRAAADIAGGLRQGYGLGSQMARHPRLFPRFFCLLVSAGEEHDSLLPALDTLTEHYHQRHRFSRRLARVLFYPCLLLLLAVGAGVFALWWVVPAFAGLYAAMGADVPPASAAVFALSRWLTPLRLLLAVSLLAAAGLSAAYCLRRLPWPAAARVPLLGAIAAYYFCHITAMVLAAGHGLERALELTAESFPRGPAPLALAGLRQGRYLSESLSQSGDLHSFVVQGESVGQLGHSLEQGAGFFRLRVDDGLDGLQQLAEPLSILVVGGVVAAMLLVLMLPMFQLAKIM